MSTALVVSAMTDTDGHCQYLRLWRRASGGRAVQESQEHTEWEAHTGWERRGMMGEREGEEIILGSWKEEE